MKKTIQFLLLVILSAEVLACGGSYQYRLFPIGQEGRNLIVIETSFNRYWEMKRVKSLL